MHLSPAENRVEVVDPPGLAAHRPAWRDLAAHAAEPNPFYEPALLLPALRHLREGRRVRCVLVYRGGELCGLFPVVRRRALPRVPWPALSLWDHRHCFLAVPLVRPDGIDATLDAFLGACRRLAGGPVVVRWPLLDQGGPVAAAITHHGVPIYVEQTFARPLMRFSRPEPGSGQSRGLCKRLRRFLRQGGEFEALPPDGDPGWWLETFLRLEASGWKGRTGTALACHPADRTFFLEAAREAHQGGLLRMTVARAEGQAVAMDCNFLARDGLFLFKTGYDEQHARLSPGAVLEAWNAGPVHAADVRWIDSCVSTPGSPLERVMPDRREIGTWLVSDGGAVSGLMVRALNGLRQLKRGHLFPSA